METFKLSPMVLSYQLILSEHLLILLVSLLINIPVPRLCFFFDRLLAWVKLIFFIFVFLLMCILNVCEFPLAQYGHGHYDVEVATRLLDQSFKEGLVDIKLGCFWTFCRSPSRSRSPKPAVSLALL